MLPANASLMRRSPSFGVLRERTIGPLTTSAIEFVTEDAPLTVIITEDNASIITEDSP